MARQTWKALSSKVARVVDGRLVRMVGVENEGLRMDTFARTT